VVNPAIAPARLPRRRDLTAQAKGLVVRRGGRIVLDRLTFTIARGRVAGLLGPSGCGKTTLVRTLVGVQMITAAQVELLGVPVGDTQLQRRVGYATQESAVYGDLTLAEDLPDRAAGLTIPSGPLST
jgi:ABC-2 type transport system ATP-binding protein